MRTKASYTQEVPTGGAGVVACQRPQRGEGDCRAGYLPAATLPLGTPWAEKTEGVKSKGRVAQIGSSFGSEIDSLGGFQ